MSTGIVVGVLLFYSASFISGFALAPYFRKLSFYKTALAALAGMAGVGADFLFGFGSMTPWLLLIFQMGSLALFFATAASGFSRRATLTGNTIS